MADFLIVECQRSMHNRRIIGSIVQEVEILT